MTLPSSGVMSASMINVELGRASNAPFDINGSAERTLAEVPTGIIKFSDFYGKSNIPPPPPPILRWKLYQNGILRGEEFLTAALACAAWSYYAGTYHEGLISNIGINVTLGTAPASTALGTRCYNVLNSSNAIMTTPGGQNGAAPYWYTTNPAYKLVVQSAGNTAGGVLTLPVVLQVPV